MKITKLQTVNAENSQFLKDVWEGEFPEYHSAEYRDARLNSGYVFLASINGEAAGFLIYSMWWGNCPFIELVKVREKFRRKGVAKSLIDAAKSEIRTKGFSQLVSSTEVVNDIGDKMHKSLGFEELNTLMLPHGEEKFFKINLDEKAG